MSKVPTRSQNKIGSERGASFFFLQKPASTVFGHISAILLAQVCSEAAAGDNEMVRTGNDPFEERSNAKVASKCTPSGVVNV